MKYVKFTETTFRVIPHDVVPIGWHLATVKDVKKYKEEARKAFTTDVTSCCLADGKIYLSRGKYETESGSFPQLDHTLIVKYCNGKYLKRIKDYVFA